MKQTVRLETVDATWVRVRCEEEPARELAEKFTFEVPGAQYTPQYKGGFWDGKIRLFSLARMRTYAGLAHRVKEFCDANGYDFEYTPAVFPGAPLGDYGWMEIDPKYEPRSYQVEAVDKGVGERRILMLSPTASGKSLMIYMLLRVSQTLDAKKALLVVPRSSLVKQMLGDFRDYAGGCQGWRLNDHVHVVEHGQKHTQKWLTITTWQAIHRMAPAWFEQFGTVVVDEAHEAKAKSLTRIMERCTQAYRRYGFTGTLDGSSTNQMVLEGLFGPVHRVTTTAQLMDDGYISRCRISAVRLVHPQSARRKMEWEDELDYLCGLEPRNDFIARLVTRLRGNTLVIYRYVEKHGEILFRKVRHFAPDRRVFFVHGGIPVDEREAVRKSLDVLDDVVLVASAGTFSTGVNAPRIHNCVMASPWKSQVVNLQTLGRGLRLADDKEFLDFYDLGDDLSYKVRGATRPNHTLRHMRDRVAIYQGQRLEPKIYGVNLEY